MRATRLLTIVIAAWLSLLPGLAGAQSFSGLPRSPILTVDSERLFSDSRYGARLSSKIEAQASRIAADNRRIEGELAEEERRLTDLRPKTDPEKFRVMAEAFDAKVTDIRREREEMTKTLGQDSDAARRAFLKAAEPVLNSLMQEAGAAVILEQRSVFVARDIVDITDEAIERIDAALLDEDGAVKTDPDADATPDEPVPSDPADDAPADDAPNGTAPQGDTPAPPSPTSP
ncbi:OmpH family outer membrane protein [Pseudooceanicola sediminis]|uniref:OmpH family outer membrane protein n=1 Tax=Pseudooceanicola sediminis TaxID=2211117 RepID=A0A399J5J9_9RHOB|nr:OmpH family outer membrane protein [Pseudooceanicola sediminis]KAA2316871.1 OmpH family outer membrane protein [Puniceibacterium sp. HSS470]RII40675.1 OmpH family outer membrane protein [Pseudooceanicola sediminis]|tara:strand:- start:131197 stop:131889 length:693 start_codon:yes stop_codon:yes gene_type:complete